MPSYLTEYLLSAHHEPPLHPARRAGFITANGYRRIGLGSRNLKDYEHRVVWAKHHGPIPPGCHIHHKNGNKLDNRIENLELFTAAQHNHIHKRRVNWSLARRLWNRGDPIGRIADTVGCRPDTVSKYAVHHEWPLRRRRVACDAGKCVGVQHAHGLCNACYSYHRKHGTLAYAVNRRRQLATP